MLVVTLAIIINHHIDAHTIINAYHNAVGEMPSHGHAMRYKSSGGTLPWGWLYENSDARVSATVETNSGIGLTGSSQKHNTVQAYMVVYMYHRIT